MVERGEHPSPPRRLVEQLDPLRRLLPEYPQRLLIIQLNGRRHPSPNPLGKRSSAPSSPEDICRLFQQYMAEGDIDSVLSVYDPEAVFLTQSGEVKKGAEACDRSWPRSRPEGQSLSSTSSR